MSRLCIVIVWVLCLQHPGDLAAVEATDKITTFAGGVAGGYSGDGGPANEAKLTEPRGIFIDEKGVIYIADTNNHVIRRVGIDGVITTVAGTGDPGYSGDGGPATEALIRDPWDVAVDSRGNMYIAGNYNQVVRRVDPDGIITTYVGTGKLGEGSVGGEGAFNGEDGEATKVDLFRPRGLALDRSGNLYISDSQNHRIRKVGFFTEFLTTVAGAGPGGIVGGAGGVGDFAGDGESATGEETRLGNPAGIAVSAGGDIYIADVRNHRIRLVSVGSITTFAGGRGDRALIRDDVKPMEADLFQPHGVAVDAEGSVYIADTLNHRIRIVTQGRIRIIAGSSEDKDTDGNPAGKNTGDGGPANQARLNRPFGVAVDADGINVYFVDTVNHLVRRVGPDGILSLMVTSLAFDTTGVDGSSEQTLEVHNTGTGSLTLTGFTFSGTGRRDYQGQETLPTIDAGGIETVTVIFTPSREGARPATMFVESDAGHKGIDVTGFAVEGGPEISLSASTLALETIKVGENAVQGTITITNPGVSDLSVTAITLEGADVSEFDISPTGVTIAPGGSETITITFDPASIGNKSITMLVDHNAGDQLIVDLTAVAEGGPVLSLPADVVSFDGVEAETIDQGSFTITNPGTEDLSITGITVEGTHASEYEVSTTQVTIASGGSETITVIFSPTSPGTKSASLLIDHNAGDPTTVRLSGVVYAAGTSPDFDGTGKVDLDDFFLFAVAFGQEPTGDNVRFDLDGNNKIDFDDFFLFAGAFGKDV